MKLPKGQSTKSFTKTRSSRTCTTWITLYIKQLVSTAQKSSEKLLLKAKERITNVIYSDVIEELLVHQTTEEYNLGLPDVDSCVPTAITRMKISKHYWSDNTLISYRKHSINKIVYMNLPSRLGERSSEIWIRSTNPAMGLHSPPLSLSRRYFSCKKYMYTVYIFRQSSSCWRRIWVNCWS